MNNEQQESKSAKRRKYKSNILIRRCRVYECNLLSRNSFNSLFPQHGVALFDHPRTGRKYVSITELTRAKRQRRYRYERYSCSIEKLYRPKQVSTLYHLSLSFIHVNLCVRYEFSDEQVYKNYLLSKQIIKRLEKHRILNCYVSSHLKQLLSSCKKHRNYNNIRRILSAPNVFICSSQPFYHEFLFRLCYMHFRDSHLFNDLDKCKVSFRKTFPCSTRFNLYELWDKLKGLKCLDKKVPLHKFIEWIFPFVHFYNIPYLRQADFNISHTLC